MYKLNFDKNESNKREISFVIPKCKRTIFLDRNCVRALKLEKNKYFLSLPDINVKIKYDQNLLKPISYYLTAKVNEKYFLLPLPNLFKTSFCIGHNGDIEMIKLLSNKATSEKIIKKFIELFWSTIFNYEHIYDYQVSKNNCPELDLSLWEKNTLNNKNWSFQEIDLFPITSVR